MRWLPISGALMLAAASCSDTGEVERIREADEVARQTAETPTATLTSASTTATPQQQELLLEDRYLLLLIAPDHQDVSAAWGATFVLSAATIEDYRLRPEYDSELTLLHIVIELMDTDVTASIPVDGFIAQFAPQGFVAEDLAIGDRAMRLTRTEASGVVVDSLNFASGRVFARLTANSDGEILVELLRVASSLLAKLGPVADQKYGVSAAPRSGFTAAKIDEVRM